MRIAMLASVEVLVLSGCGGSGGCEGGACAALISIQGTEYDLGCLDHGVDPDLLGQAVDVTYRDAERVAGVTAQARSIEGVPVTDAVAVRIVWEDEGPS